MREACSAHGEDKTCLQISIRKPEGKRPLGGPRYRWEDNIEVELREVELNCVAGFMGYKTGTDGGLLCVR